MCFQVFRKLKGAKVFQQQEAVNAVVIIDIDTKPYLSFMNVHHCRKSTISSWNLVKTLE